MSAALADFTACCIVGGGPAGVMLALLLARQGVEVTLLEAQPNFEREFRGDTVYPSTLELLEHVGLSQALHRLPHSKAESVRLVWQGGALEVARFDRLSPRFPYVMQMPQAQLLEFLVAEAQSYPNFRLELGAKVESLIEQDGEIGGVRYRQGERLYTLRSRLTIGCDGRGSRVRGLAGLDEGKGIPSATDLLWFKIPHPVQKPTAQPVDLHLGAGYYLIALEHRQHWQVGLGIPKHGFAKVREAGLEQLQQNLQSHLPWLQDGIKTLQDWSQVRLLSVKTSHLPRWSRPGLLMIGDAAHTMSPVGGVGINLAIQDAVDAAQRLAQPLLQQSLSLQHLRVLQRRRTLPTRFTQWWTRQLEAQLAHIMTTPKPKRSLNLLKTLTHLPYTVDLSTRLIGYGLGSPKKAF